MDLLISMKAETLNKGICFKESNIMQMPTAQSNGNFIAEYRESDEEKLRLLNRYVGIMEQKLNGKEKIFIQRTPLGFKLLKPVDEDLGYMEAWDNWVVFAWDLFRELKEIVGE